jgi:hypothetical protein
MKIRTLPIYVSSFEKMIQGNYLYIDKTEHIYNLFKGDSHYYFLSRPRRFGKTLLVSTLKEFFLGKKKLFDGLWIASSDYTWQEYPVIHLDFSTIPHLTAQELRININKELQSIAQKYDITYGFEDTPEVTLKNLVVNLSKTNKVVILIDEYDKPILDHLHTIEEARKQREILKSFYGVIKGIDPYLRAVFLTGVTRFSKTSIFSGINNLNDLSLDPKAAQLLGYTQQEIKQYFTTYIEELASANNTTSQEMLQELQRWYNGYRFSEEEIKVYNPFSILYALDKQKLRNYWFESGTPSFLVHLLKQHYSSLREIKDFKIDQSDLGSFDIDKIPLITLLFQAGYLTISNYDQKTGLFTLNYPNLEVADSFTKYIIASFAQTNTSAVKQLSIQLIDALKAKDLDQFCNLLRTFIAHIPYNLHIKQESFYHALIQSLFTLLSLESQSELLTDKGRIDCVLSMNSFIYLFEIKFNHPAEVALQQIKDRRYYERFQNQGKKIILVGLAFNRLDDDFKISYTSEEIE